MPALRAIFGDAVEDRLADENPFARLGLAVGGRQDIVVLTRDEVHELARIARAHHGGAFGEEVAALILWAAYTCMRPGEISAARYSLLDGDVYDLRRQFNSTLRRETEPKHNSTGTIYVIGSEQDAAAQAPLITAFVQEVLDSARRLAIAGSQETGSERLTRCFRRR